MFQRKPIDAVVDLESLGLAPTSAITEIGVTLVKQDGASLVFHRHIELGSALKFGTVDAETLLWWMSPEQDEARELLVDGLKHHAVPLPKALEDLDAWLTQHEVARLWANGASFDLGLLAHAYHATGVKRNFSFRYERDLRTAFDLVHTPSRVWPDGFVKHCALHDALVDGQRLWEVLYLRNDGNLAVVENGQGN